MKPHLAIVVILATLLLPVRASSQEDDTRYDEGVSRSLAQWRKTSIHDVRYQLYFDLVNNKGAAAIYYSLNKAQEVVFDFRNTALVTDVAIGDSGERPEFECRNEHIVLSAAETHRGSNCITIFFDIDNQSLNRNDAFLYTLLVPDRARTLFPCFDQPDMKASYQLNLIIPREWVAVSNTAECTVDMIEDYIAYYFDRELSDDERVVSFQPTEPLSTYLFSFVAGELYSTTYDDGNHRFTAYYRETDPERLTQLDDIFHEVASSLEWLEEYTGIDYPFAKYDFVMLPGFQYGGMEHTGATLYNASQMFLGENATLEEHLRRTQLIAHETAHMWFGDYVTMEWFDDVWTKEIFANYFAARMAEPLYPDVNHRLNRLKTYTQAAYSEDRTYGATAIHQELDNLRYAGLIYGQTIYNKAPIVLDKIVELMGEEPFRLSIQEYLTTYAYGNASWNDLVEIMDRHSAEDISQFSNTWVDQVRMPIVTLSRDNGCYTLKDAMTPAWIQSFNCYVEYSDGSSEVVEITINTDGTTLEFGSSSASCGRDIAIVVPNVDGRGYGLFELPAEVRCWMMENMASTADDLMRQSMLVMLNELCEQRGDTFPAREWLDFLLDYLPAEENYLIGSTINGYIARLMLDVGTNEDEARLMELANNHPNSSLQRNLMLTLARVMRSDSSAEYLFDLWLSNQDARFNESDAMAIAYELAVRLPERYDFIHATQLERLTNPDRRAQFDYIIRGAHPDLAVRDELFASLFEPANRRPEPWAASMLGLLNHHTRQSDAVKYIYPALEELSEVQRTGDIFFPRNWVGSLLGGHSSREALDEVERFFNDHPDYLQLLHNKAMQAAWHLHRAYRMNDISCD